MKAGRVRILSLAVAAMISGTAFAATQFDDEQVAVPRSVSQDKSQTVKETVLDERGFVSENGSPKGDVSVVKGFGKDVSILLALKQVTPAGWQAKKSGQVDVMKTISWKGGRPWTEVLRDVAAEGRVNVLVDWDAKTLVVSQARPTVTKVSSVASSETVEKEAVKAVAPQKVWVLEQGKTLRENIEVWASKTSSPKWSVAWNAANYQIKFPASFVGEFDDEKNGPIVSIIEAFRNHDIPLRADFQDDNHVLKIENAAFSQQTGKVKKMEEEWNGNY